MAAAFAGLLLNAQAQAMPSDCHTAEAAVSTVHALLQQAPADGGHQEKQLKDRLCCTGACIVCVASLPSPAASAWSGYVAPSYFPGAFAGMTGQGAPAVFEPPRSILH